MQFILKIGPRHCPDGSFRPDKDGKNWIGVKFEVPKPKAILGAATRETIEPGDKAWIWTHHDKRRDGELRGRGLVGDAIVTPRVFAIHAGLDLCIRAFNLKLTRA